MSRRTSHGSGVWWLSPVGAVLLVAPTTLYLAARYDPVLFRVDFRSPKSLSADTVQLLVTGIAAFVLGALLSQLGRPARRPAQRWPALEPAQVAVLQRAATPLFLLTMTGYAFFIVSAARNGVRPGDLLSALLAQDVYGGDLKEDFSSVAGITTLTQVGIVFTVVAVLVLLHGPHRRTALQLAAVLVLTLLRAYLLTERLALLEILVPVGCLLALAVAHRAPPGRALLLRTAPLPLLLLLVVVFAAFEYSRSYTFYAGQSDQGLGAFAVDRLSGYYATAYNNGELALRHSLYPERLPYSTLEGLWTAPGVEQLRAYERLSGRDYGEQYRRVLDTYGNREFNSPSGLAAPYVDYGRNGGTAVLLGLGLGVGLLHRACLAGRPVGLLAYPIVVTGLYELPRFIYWVQGRVVPSALALVVVAVALHRAALTTREARA